MKYLFVCLFFLVACSGGGEDGDSSESSAVACLKSPASQEEASFEEEGDFDEFVEEEEELGRSVVVHGKAEFPAIVVNNTCSDGSVVIDFSQSSEFVRGEE